jgi:hypothetical protein
MHKTADSSEKRAQRKSKKCSRSLSQKIMNANKELCFTKQITLTQFRIKLKLITSINEPCVKKIFERDFNAHAFLVVLWEKINSSVVSNNQKVKSVRCGVDILRKDLRIKSDWSSAANHHLAEIFFRNFIALPINKTLCNCSLYSD